MLGYSSEDPKPSQFFAKGITPSHHLVIVFGKVISAKHPIKSKNFLPIFAGRLFSQMMMLLENNNVGFMAMKDVFFVNNLKIGSKKWWATAINNVLKYGGGTGAALTADMTLTFLAKGGYSSFYRKGRETKTGYIMYKTLLYTAFH
ncbi:MAG: hypothetical protein JJU02_10220 [Cryomorphaceae bacterium]|nr:hypothetical protein [Cryomorphaceae bacterium]